MSIPDEDKKYLPPLQTRKSRLHKIIIKAISAAVSAERKPSTLVVMRKLFRSMR